MRKDSSATSFKRVSHWPVTLLSGVSALVNLAMPIAMSRCLPPEEVGAFKIFFLYLASVPALALSNGIINGISFWGGQGEAGRRSIQSAWRVLVHCAIGFPLLLSLLLPLYRLVAGGSGADWPALYTGIFLLACVPTVLGNFYETSCVATGKVWRGAIFAASFELARTFGILVSVLFFRNAVVIFWVHTGIVSLKALSGLWLGRRDGMIAGGIRIREAREILRYAFPVSMAGTFDLLLNYSDRFILSAFLTASQYAIYTFGCLALPPLQILEQSVNRVLIPQLSECIHRGELDRGVRLYRHSVDEMMAFFIPSVAGLIVFADPIVELLFTSRYIEASDYLRIFALSYLMLGIPTDIAARAAGDGKWILRVSIGLGIFSVAAGSLMAWKWGAKGALVAALAAIALHKLAGLRDLRVRFGWRIRDVLPFSSMFFYAAVSAALSAASWSYRPQAKGEMHWFLVCGTLFALVYLALIIPVKWKSLRGLRHELAT